MSVVESARQARIHAFALEGAGEAATGPESWFYPLDPS